MKPHALLAAICALLPGLASAACISCYTPATTPLGGTEVVLGHQGGADVDIGVDDLARRAAALSLTFSGSPTFSNPVTFNGTAAFPGTITGATTFTGAVTHSSTVTDNGVTNLNSTTNGPDGSIWTSVGLGSLGNLTFASGKTLTWGAVPLYPIGVGSAGSARIDFKEGSIQYGSLEENSGASSWNMPAGGAYCWSLSADTCFWRQGAGWASLGNGTPADANGRLDLATLDATTKVQLPGNGIGGNVDMITPTLASLQGQQVFVGGTTLSPLAISAASATYAGGGIIGGAYLPGSGLTIQGEPSSGTFFAPMSSYAQAWSLQIFNSAGFQVAGIENGLESNHIQFGATRASPDMFSVSQLVFTDFVANGVITGFSGVVAGGGYVNGTYVDVPLTGGAGRLAHADITVSGGAVTAVALHAQPRGGYDYMAGDVLSASNANLGGAGSGFSVHASTVTSGATPGPVIVLNADVAGNDYVGFGQRSATPGDNTIRFGGSGNYSNPWDNANSAQANPNLDVSGALVLSTNDGTNHNAQAQLQAMAGGVKVTQPASATAAPISVSFVRGSPTTVAGLATIDTSPVDGDRAYVTDADACTFMSTVVHTSGSTHCPVHYDGSSSSWKAG